MKMTGSPLLRERDDRGTALWTQSDVDRLQRVHAIVSETTLTSADIQAVVAAEAGADRIRAGLTSIAETARRREHVSLALADLEYARLAVHARRSALDAVDEALAHLQESVRMPPVGLPTAGTIPPVSYAE